MKFGICCSPAALENETASFAESVARLKSSGVDYLEFPVASLTPESDAGALENLQLKVAQAALPVEAFNGFLPAHQRITGPEVDLRAVLEYCQSALERCKALGGDVVVLGSGKARCVPDGFDGARAEKQFVEFCRELAPIAQENAITIAIEPLNTREDNLICSVAHGAQIVDAVAQPSIQLLADFYHMMEESEPLDNIVQANGRLRHTHLADIGRVVPGTAGNGEADFTGFFRALKGAGYIGSTPDTELPARCSFEGHSEDLMVQTAPMIELLRARLAAS
jgi:sugar phosphate isomerase/epimerase